MSSIRIDHLADDVMKGLNEYAEVTTDNVKKAVRKAASTVRREIQTKVPPYVKTKKSRIIMTK